VRLRVRNAGGSVRTLPLIAAAAAVVAPLMPAPAFGATDTTPPVIVSEQIVGPSSFDLTGMNVANVAVQVHLTDDTGVTSSGCPNPGDCFNGPFIRVSRGRTLLPSIDAVAYALSLTSGNDRDGEWQATVPVSAGSTGTWSVFVAAADDAGNVAAQPQMPARYSVSGHDAPTIEGLTFTPNVTATPTSQPSTVTGFVQTASTHHPLANASVNFGSEVFQCGNGEPANTTRTDATGHFRISVATMPPGGCVDVLEALTTAERQAGQRPAHYSDLPLVGEVRYALSAQVTATPIRVGQSTSVIGSVGNNAFSPVRVLLQRWANGAWRTVGTARVRPSARYTLTATPPGPGNWRYRVVKPSDGCDQKTHRCFRLGRTSATLLVGAD
jgi:hypothetical protein